MSASLVVKKSSCGGGWPFVCSRHGPQKRHTKRHQVHGLACDMPCMTADQGQKAKVTRSEGHVMNQLQLRIK